MKKLLLIIIGVVGMFAAGYSAATSFAYPAGGVWGRGEYNGYFTNVDDTQGAEVLRPVYSGEAFPSTINSASEFINFIKYTKLDIDNNGSGDARDKTGAAFIIHTMIGSSAANRRRPPTAAQIAEWERRVNFAAANNRVTWRTNYSFRINSFYQGVSSGSNPNDDAFYDDSDTKASMLFRNASGAVVYALKWECGNPVGTTSLGPIPDDANWNLYGTSTVNNASPAPGQTIVFTHEVRNAGPNSTAPRSVSVGARNGLAPNNVTMALTARGPLGVQTSFHRYTETVVVPLSAVPGSQICRQSIFNPDTAAGGTGIGTNACATVRYDFTLRPTITILVNGAPLPPNSVAEPGDTLQIQYAVINGGLTVSQPASCTIYRNTFTGYHAAPDPAESTVGWAASSAGTGCPRSFPGNNTNTPLTGANETIVLTAANVNRSFCRVLSVTPSTQNGGTAATESCVQIGAKPYLRVYGGDVSAGNGWPTSCTVSDSSIMTWNKRSPTFSGAGVQYAAFAIGEINEFATAYGNPAGAPDGSGLAFANNTATPPSVFGGDYGTLPCNADYYGRRALTATQVLPTTNLSALPNGKHAYTATGPITISGNINPGQQTVLYVDGNVYINNPIRYTGSWNTGGNMPMFQLVVRGNIYIGQGVTQLDGIYIAQPTNPTATNGVIYTCAGGMNAPVATNDPNVYTRCSNSLVINGAFVARDIQFLRTRGTLSQSDPAEPLSNIAEVFRFSPAAWMMQPPVPTGSAGTYDAITSLPPIL